MPGLADLVRPAAALAARGALEVHALAMGARAGLLAPESPQRLAAVARAIDRYGPIGSAIVIAGLRHGERTALVDERGSVTFAQLDRRSDALACALRDRGVGAAEGIGVLCRNHRGLLDITFAATKLGARALYLNTDFAGPQLREVCAREGVDLLVCDEEYTELVESIEAPRGRLLAWTDGPPGDDTLDALIAAHDGEVPDAPDGRSSVVLLTSGTTGTPKGAPRSQGRSLAPMGALFSKVPFRGRESTYIAAPMFHALGFAQSIVAIGLGSTIVTHRRFKPQAALEAIAEHRCTALIVVPVMLQRMVACIEAQPGRFDVSSLRIVFVSGSQLEAELARRGRAAFGDTLYNLYGSTEVAWATFATPEDLREAPGCAGRPPFGTTVRLYDGDGRPVVGPGRRGRIFVGNTFQFEGYTGGETKDVLDGLMSSGDIGHFDEAGRLFIDGRDDDMIVSGGENLFPGEVEELLLTHEAIEEASVIGVDDPEWGKRLAAFVALKPGRELSEQEVKDFVKGNLARFKVPRDVSFVDALPRNPSGKVLKRELQEQHAT